MPTNPPRASSVIGFRKDKDADAARSLWTDDAFTITDEIDVSMLRVKAAIGMGSPAHALGHAAILRNLLNILETQLKRWKEEMSR